MTSLGWHNIRQPSSILVEPQFGWRSTNQIIRQSVLQNVTQHNCDPLTMSIVVRDMNKMLSYRRETALQGAL